MSLITQGIMVMLLGLAGVFAVLIIFYICTKIMLVISKRSHHPKM
jgi:Na+-transporting methylmalonyl-CoA/oxaloacetate decarboxylase gamma subunit